MYKLGPNEDGYHVFKRGNRVKNSEVEAMDLVLIHTKLPIPEIVAANFNDPDSGKIWMTFIEGKRLDSVWETLDSNTKERLCKDIWTYISILRSEVPRPKDDKGCNYPLQCLADGSATKDALLVDDEPPQYKTRPRPILNDDDLRQRIYVRYRANGGDRYAATLPDMLPRSSPGQYVFTHGDIAPRNILVNDCLDISAVLDWENSGWYPYYWEHANIMRPAGENNDWQKYMDRTAPPAFKCDLSGITAARRVLF